MKSDVTVLYWDELNSSELAAGKLSIFFGAKVSYIDAAGSALLSLLVSPAKSGWRGCLIVSADVLAKVQQRQDGAEVCALLLRAGTSIFVFGFHPRADHDAMLSSLTKNQIVGVRKLDSGNESFEVFAEPEGVTRHFVGLRFSGPNPRYDYAFRESAPGEASILIRAGNSPFFVDVTTKSARIMLLACLEVSDIDQAVSRDATLASLFSRLVPLMLFLRKVLGRRIWHNNHLKACFIIDDPLLKRQYGFLNFEKLLRAAQARPFSMSIAFIPWNYRRSNKQTIELFKRNSKTLSLCVHGCDHTSREFAATDYAHLLHSATIAMKRMNQHKALTQLGFDDVMVFPQGAFSIRAMLALKAAGYRAAVNSTLFPTDAAHDSLSLRDMLSGAVTAFGGVPLFGRRYPQDALGLATDLFLGKPILLVEHHNYFRRGYGELLSVIDWLNKTEPGLKWTNLANACAQTSWEREAGDNEVYVQFFTDKFRLMNTFSHVQSFVISHPFPGNATLPWVKVNGVRHRWESESGALVLRLELKAGCAAELEIERDVVGASPITNNAGAPAQLKVLARRLLSEFRDNCVDRSFLLHRVSRQIRNYLPKGNLRSSRPTSG